MGGARARRRPMAVLFFGSFSHSRARDMCETGGRAGGRAGGRRAQGQGACADGRGDDDGGRRRIERDRAGDLRRRTRSDGAGEGTASCSAGAGPPGSTRTWAPRSAGGGRDWLEVGHGASKVGEVTPRRTGRRPTACLTRAAGAGRRRRFRPTRPTRPCLGWRRCRTRARGRPRAQRSACRLL